MAAPEGSEEGEIAESPAGPGSGFSSENRNTTLETPDVATTTLSSAVSDAPPQLEQDHAPWPVPPVLVNANESTDLAATGYSTQLANTAWARGPHVEEDSKSVYSTASDGSHDVSASDGDRAPSGEASPGLKTKRDEETRGAVHAVVDDGEREEGELEEGEIPVEELGDFEASESVRESAPPAADIGAAPEALRHARSPERGGSKHRDSPNIDGSPSGRLWAESRRRGSRSPKRRSRERTGSRSPRREHRSGRAWPHRSGRSRSRERRRILERRERSLEGIAERRWSLERRRSLERGRLSSERRRDRERSSSQDRRRGYSHERARAVAGRREGWMDKPRQERSPGGDRGKSRELGGERRSEEEPRSSPGGAQARLLKEAKALAEKVTVEDAQK
jgi:hypothetical protein